MSTLSQVITAAVADIEEHGYDSPERIDGWIKRILAITNVYSQAELMDYLKRSLGTKYKSLVTDNGILKTHEIPAFRLEQIKPQLRAELDRRIMASAQLIVLNRDAAIQKTLKRFAGWSTSIPIDGSKTVDTSAVKFELKKKIKDLSFIERRVAIDQGHKLIANISDIVATEGGAIAAIWHSHWRTAGYDYDPKHKALDDKIFVIRGNWAIEQGLMKLDGHQYTDEIEKPSVRPYCRCYFQYLYAVRKLPEGMQTKKYKELISAKQVA
jgi:hypothetical protein